MKKITIFLLGCMLVSTTSAWSMQATDDQAQEDIVKQLIDGKYLGGLLGNDANRTGREEVEVLASYINAMEQHIAALKAQEAAEKDKGLLEKAQIMLQRYKQSLALGIAAAVLEVISVGAIAFDTSGTDLSTSNSEKISKRFEFMHRMYMKNSMPEHQALQGSQAFPIMHELANIMPTMSPISMIIGLAGLGCFYLACETSRENSFAGRLKLSNTVLEHLKLVHKERIEDKKKK